MYASKKQCFKELLLTVVIVCYVFQVVVSLSPDFAWKQRLTAPGKQFFLFWGLNQNWALFSPSIRDINFHVVATIEFDDGFIMYWQLPRMDRLDLFQRFRLEKFRKWGIDALPWPNYKPYWPDFARYAGRLFMSADRKPSRLSLHLFWTKIPKPSGDGSIVDRYKLPEHNNSYAVFTYFYKPEDFE